MADHASGADPQRRLPGYADEEEIAADARAVDLALLAEARRRGRAFASALAELRDGAELSTTDRYLDSVRDGVGDLADWLDDASAELKASPTPVERRAHRDEQAELHQRLWRR